MTRLWPVRPDRAADLDLAEPPFAAAPGLWLVRSARTRSRLCHAAKRQLLLWAALLAGGLAGDPKAGGLAPGVTRFLGDPGPQA